MFVQNLSISFQLFLKPPTGPNPFTGSHQVIDGPGFRAIRARCSSNLGSERLEMGMAQTTRRLQVLVVASISQGNPFWVPSFDLPYVTLVSLVIPLVIVARA